MREIATILFQEILSMISTVIQVEKLVESKQTGIENIKDICPLKDTCT